MKKLKKLQISTSSLSQIKTPYYAFSPSAAPEKDKWEKILSFHIEMPLFSQ